MANRSHSIEFKRQVAQEFLAEKNLYALSKRHDISRQLIRVWVQKYEANVLEENAQAADLTPIFHPSVIGLPYRGMMYGQQQTLVLTKCPRCNEKRERRAREVRLQMISVFNFQGYCKRCSYLSRRDGTHLGKTWGRGRYHHGGYLLLAAHDVDSDLLPMFRQMQDRAYKVLEHRWVMAKHLGRALARNECVDHMNGDKLDNRIENLRIYVKGKNQPGSSYGYGTYYHEWQMALRRIRELEQQLQRTEVAVDRHRNHDRDDGCYG